MFSNAEVAARVSALMLEFGAKLNESVADVQETCPEPEFLAYRDAVSRMMFDMLVRVMNPIYAVHPELKPPELG